MLDELNGLNGFNGFRGLVMLSGIDISVGFMLCVQICFVLGGIYYRDNRVRWRMFLGVVIFGQKICVVQSIG